MITLDATSFLKLTACGRTIPYNQAMSWLESQRRSPRIVIDGKWNSDDWGEANLSQRGRRVQGTIGGYDAEGVVSGTRVYLVITYNGSVHYTAVAKATTNRINGTYNDRGGFADVEAGYPFVFSKLGQPAVYLNSGDPTITSGDSDDWSEDPYKKTLPRSRSHRKAEIDPWTGEPRETPSPLIATLKI